MKKKVLVISYSYPPSNAPAAQRPYALAKYLDKNKFNVSVIICGNADSSLGFDATMDVELPNVKLIKINSKFGSATKSQKTKTGAKGKSSLITVLKKQVYNIISNFTSLDKASLWFPEVIKYLKNNPTLISDCDIVFTTSPLFTNHNVGAFIANENTSVKWVADFRDFHFIEREDKIKHGARKSFKRVEENVIDKANQVVFISNAMKDAYKVHYEKYAHKFNVVYNGFDIEDFDMLKCEPVQSKTLDIFYAGSFHNGERSPIPLLKVLDTAITENLIDKEQIKVKIAGKMSEEVKNEIKDFESFSCIEFLGLLPRKEVLKRFTETTLLWLIVGNRLTHYTGVPIKFYEYLAARRPILNFAPSMSEPTKMIGDNRLGWSFNTENLNDQENNELFKEVIAKFKEGNLVNPLPEASLKIYARAHQAALMQDIFDI